MARARKTKYTVDDVVKGLKDGKIKQAKLSDSSILCHPGCLGYHRRTYIEFKNNKFYYIIDGDHHALPVDFFGRPVWRRSKEVSEEEARELIEIAIKTDSLVVR